MIPKISTKSTPLSSDPIGVFDSGVGGLSVLRELQKLLPHERFVFVADQSYVPYGAKTGPQLEKRTAAISRFLIKQRCKIIVVACNTATCYAIDHLRNTFTLPFIGTVPAVKPACEQSKSGVVGVISTPATAKSAALKKLVKDYAHGVRVIAIGCPGLEELVERGGINHPDATVLLKKYLAPIIAAGADRVVLGCTHYPFLKTTVRRIGKAVTVDSGLAVARQTKRVLAAANLLAGGTPKKNAFFTTASAASFSSVASTLLKQRISSRHIDV